ncbi:MAG: cytochrome c [Pseudomonadota bacterium]
MLRFVTAAALALITLSSASAQNLDAIKARKDTLKGMGKATEAPGAMMKGEAPFDLAKVKAALAAYQDGAAKLPDLFPDDSKTGGETEALPVIWEKKQDVIDRYKKLAADAKAATATITDEFSFQEEFPKVVGNCSACHKVYRKPKE